MMDRERPAAPQVGPIPEAWIGQEVMLETTEALSSDLRAAAPVYLEDVSDRGVVMMVTRHRDHNRFSRYFYPWGVVGWIRLAEDDEQEEEERPRAARPRAEAISLSATVRRTRDEDRDAGREDNLPTGGLRMLAAGRRVGRAPVRTGLPGAVV